MNFLIAGIFLIGSIFLSFVLRGDFESLIIVIATFLGFTLGKVLDLQKDVKSLRQSLAKDWERRYTPSKKTTPAVKTPDKYSEKPLVHAENNDKEVKEYRETSQITPAATILETPKETKAFINEQLYNKNSPVYKDYKTPSETIFDKGIAYLKDYFTGGNLFVRIGIIILFFGVSFLLKYVSDRGLFPIEYRLIGVVVGAIALLGLGWRLRHKNKTYALLLQGAGIGVLYLDIYAAFSLYHLLNPLAAFVLLFLVSIFSAAIAVMQDSKSLAVLGFSGGFLAPVLASSGSNNHVGLFSYYAVLNLAIVAVAWFKAWRPLNLLGFAFTFIIGTVWGIFSYDSSKFATTEPFLILFFLFYVLIAVLFALRQPPKLRGYVDGTLLFGVPLAASALQYSLVSNFEYGVSLSAFAMGAFYLLLSWFTLRQKGKDLKLLSEAFLALGVIFASTAIPFALAPTQTAAAWALEGAGLLWLGSRQERLSVRAFGLLLQVGAGLIFLANIKFTSTQNLFANSAFISSMMLALAGILSARLLSKPYKGRGIIEESTSPIALIWGLLWLFGGFIFTLIVHDYEKWIPTSLLLLSATSTLGFIIMVKKTKPEWKLAWVVASGLFGIVTLMAFSQFNSQNSANPYHPFQLYGWLAWPFVFAVYYYLLKQLEQHKALESMQPLFHSALAILLVILTTLEGSFQLVKHFNISADWLQTWMAIPTIVALWIITKANFWPFSKHQESYQQQAGVVFTAFLALWSMVALIADGNPTPLPWIPLLNPLDIVLIIISITLLRWWKSIQGSFALVTKQTKEQQVFKQRTFAIGGAGVAFLWLNFTLFRIAHHSFNVSFTADALFNSGLVQTAVSILWALSGVILTVYASRKQTRFLWLTGAAVLVLVVLKLFLIDLSALGSLARIVSFLVVGALLTSIGYFAPLPDSLEDHQNAKDSPKESQGENHV